MTPRRTLALWTAAMIVVYALLAFWQPLHGQDWINLQPALAGTLHTRPSDEAARVCDCNGVTRSRIVEAVLNGARSLQVAAFLERNGFGKTVNLTGGIHAWALQVDPAMPKY